MRQNIFIIFFLFTPVILEEPFAYFENGLPFIIIFIVINEPILYLPIHYTLHYTPQSLAAPPLFPLLTVLEMTLPSTWTQYWAILTPPVLTLQVLTPTTQTTLTRLVILTKVVLVLLVVLLMLILQWMVVALRLIVAVVAVVVISILVVTVVIVTPVCQTTTLPLLTLPALQQTLTPTLYLVLLHPLK